MEVLQHTTCGLIFFDATSLEDDWLPQTSCVVGHQMKNQNSTLSLTVIDYAQPQSTPIYFESHFYSPNPLHFLEHVY